MDSHYINSTTRVYEQDGEVVAVATNPTWDKDVDRQMDSMTRYYCIPGIWDVDSQTSIVSADELQRLMGKPATLVESH